MNIETFALREKVGRKTVEKWIRKGLIPKADLESDYIPDSARQPYTSARARNAKAIYFSMITAASKRKHILPSLYRICDDEFNGYIERLVKCGYIEKRISDDITYYDATVLAMEFNKRQCLEMLTAIMQGASQGITKALIDEISA